MADAECFYCSEAFTNGRFSKHARVSCPACDYVLCSDCVKRMIRADGRATPRCSNCRKDWTPGFVVQTFGRSYLDNVLHADVARAACYQAELTMMPATQAHLEGLKEADALDAEARQVQARADELKRQAAEMAARAHRLRTNGADAAEQRRATTGRRCCTEGCTGYYALDTTNGVLRCPMCNDAKCNKCREAVDVSAAPSRVPEGANKYGHVCDPGILANVQAIMGSKDTRLCPKCEQPINRTEGCSQMLCIECGTAFDWRTGEIDHGPIHNPHMLQYSRRVGVGMGQLQRRPCEDQQGLPGYYELYGALNPGVRHGYGRGLPRPPAMGPDAERLMAAQRVASHMQNSTLHTLRRSLDRCRPNVFQNNLDLRVRFMKKEITEERFKDLVKDRHRRYERTLGKFQIVEAVVAMVGDTLRGMLRHGKTAPQALEELKTVQEIHLEAVREFVGLFACACPFMNEAFEEKTMYPGCRLEPPVRKRAAAEPGTAAAEVLTIEGEQNE